MNKSKQSYDDAFLSTYISPKLVRFARGIEEVVERIGGALYRRAKERREIGKRESTKKYKNYD